MRRIEVRDLAVSYPGRDVFRGVDLTLRGGEFVGLLGPNGAGKTTLMRAVLGLIPADAGTVSAGRRPVRKVVGYVPQAHNVAWDFPIDVYDATLNATLGQRPWWHRAGEREHRAAAQQGAAGRLPADGEQPRGARDRQGNPRRGQGPPEDPPPATAVLPAAPASATARPGHASPRSSGWAAASFRSARRRSTIGCRVR